MSTAEGRGRKRWTSASRAARSPPQSASMAKTVGDQILERLHAWGVRRVFGYPGDGINGLMGAFQRLGDKMQFVQARHEELAAFMACAHAKFTGEVGVCMATSGPGAIHLLNGLYDAKADHQPVVAIVGQQARTALGGDATQGAHEVEPLLRGHVGEHPGVGHHQRHAGGRLGRHGIYVHNSAIGIDTGYNMQSPLSCLSLPDFTLYQTFADGRTATHHITTMIPASLKEMQRKAAAGGTDFSL